MARIDELREIAKNRQRAVGRKIARIKRVQGAIVKGTEFDPRKSLSDISKMRSRDLESYIRRLNNFQSRSVQFYANRYGRPIPMQIIKSINKSQNIVNKSRTELEGIYRNIPVPGGGSGNTIGDMKSRRMKTMRGEANVPFNEPINLKNLSGAKAAVLIERRAMEQSSPKRFERAIRDYRRRVDTALKDMGEEDMRSRFDNLSDFEFYALWTTPGVLERMFTVYEEIKKKTKQSIDVDEFHEDFEESMSWAEGMFGGYNPKFGYGEVR